MNFSPIIGAAQLAIGRSRGMARFRDTPQAFLASLAPLLAFPLVGAALLIVKGSTVEALIVVLLTLVAQLGPPVLSYDVARRMGREAAWLRYATAFNWCQLAMPVAAFVMLAVLQLAGGEGLDRDTAGQLLIMGLSIYGLWLNWTVARHGLALSRWRAALLVLLVNGGTVLLVMAPHLVHSVVD